MTTPVRRGADFTGSRPHGQSLRYRLDIIALDVVDVVASAGGWLYHRVASGWEVSVLVPGSQEVRPLRILGARPLDLDRELADAGAPTGHGLAVHDGAFAADARVRQWVLTGLRSSRTEITLWGERWPLAVSHRVSAVRHVLTTAGRAFKAQSLAAAEIADVAVEPSEVFRSDQKTCLPVDSDLIPC